MIRLVKSGDIVDLRNPAWGDTQEVNLNKIIRQTRAGWMLHRHPSTWGIVKRFSYKFVTLTEAVKESLKDFLQAHAAEEITLSRIEAGPVTKWTMDGYIITPVIEIITVREPCSYDATFDFQKKIV